MPASARLNSVSNSARVKPRFSPVAWISTMSPAPGKSALAIVATVALIAVLWEIGECAHDAFRLDILHEPLRNAFTHIDLLDQPTNLDTMGDLTFSIVGACIGLLSLLL